ncbi:MAG: hypothetical protein COA32_16590 [Fluviicola sp.]|nr:MAG: hypothetical protein COA32_16590 [Fluviicola sp.]
MKYLLFVYFGFITFFSLSQNEKGCTIVDGLRVFYDEENPSIQYRFSEIWSSLSTSEFSSKDTFAIALDSENDIVIRWSFFNEHYNWYYPLYDTAEWYFNDTLMESDNFSFSYQDYFGPCGTAYRAGTSVHEVKIGYYQLRQLGAGSNMNTTSFPVIHVYEKEEANLIVEEEPAEPLLYPNPASDIINLKLSKSINNGVMNVHNLQGQLVVSYPLDNLETISQYDISQLNQGMYVFSVIDKGTGKEVLRKKLVLQ